MRKRKFMEIPKANLSAASNARYNRIMVFTMHFQPYEQVSSRQQDSYTRLRRTSCLKYNPSPVEISLPQQSSNFPDLGYKLPKAEATFLALCTQLICNTSDWNETASLSLSHPSSIAFSSTLYIMT